MKRFIVIIGATLALAVLPAHLAFAHVLIADTTNTQHAVLHIDPDDDPVAGKAQTLLFIPQNLSGTTTVSIEGPSGTAHPATHPNGSETEVPYTFPTPGVYNLTFTITSGQTTYTFHHSQHINAPPAPKPAATPHYDWGKLIAIGSIILIVIVAIVIKRRNDAKATRNKE